MSSKRLLTLYYDWASPPSRALMIFLKFSSIPDITFKEVRISKNEHLQPSFLAMSPLGTLPTISEQEEGKDSFSLCES